MNPEGFKLTYPAIFHEDDDYIYIEVPDLGIEEFKIPVSDRAKMVDITWDMGSRKLLGFMVNNQSFPPSRGLEDLEVFEGNDKDAFLLEYIKS